MDVLQYRAEFPITEQYAYLNHASSATPSRRVISAVEQYLQQTACTPFDLLLDQMEGVRTQFKERIGALINAAHPDEIVPMGGTAAGINTAAQSLPLQPGDNVLVLDGDYPAVIYPWLNLASRGVLTKWVPQHRGGLDVGVLAARVDSRTRAVCVSTSMFATGYRNDIAALGTFCRERGIYFVVDGIQTLGAFDIDVQACAIDFLACGSHKWLLSLPGSGFLYCRHELLQELQPGAYVGAFSTVDPWNFLDYNFTLHESSERFTLGTPNTAGIIALHASLGLLQEVGMDFIGRRVVALTDQFVGDLQSRGYRFVSNLQPEHRSGIVVVEVPDARAAYEKLLREGIVTAVRGTGLRISPHFYNTEEEIMHVGEVLGNA